MHILQGCLIELPVGSREKLKRYLLNFLAHWGEPVLPNKIPQIRL